MNEPVRTPESWPVDFKSARAVNDGVGQLDVSPNGHWWFAGLLLGAVLLLLWALVDAREVNLEQAVRIQTLETQALQHKVERAAWVCERMTQRRGVLAKWCIKSEAM